MTSINTFKCVVEAGQTAVPEASVYIPDSINERWAIIEQSSAFPFPSGLLVLLTC